MHVVVGGLHNDGLLPRASWRQPCCIPPLMEEGCHFVRWSHTKPGSTMHRCGPPWQRTTDAVNHCGDCGLAAACVALCYRQLRVVGKARTTADYMCKESLTKSATVLRENLSCWLNGRVMHTGALPKLQHGATDCCSDGSQSLALGAAASCGRAVRTWGISRRADAERLPLLYITSAVTPNPAPLPPGSAAASSPGPCCR